MNLVTVTAEQKESLARVRRSARVIQRAIDLLGGTDEAYYWLTSPCAALRGKRPADVRYDVVSARRVRDVIRRRCDRMRKIHNAAHAAFDDEKAYFSWLWKRCDALDGRIPAMLLDTERGAREVARAISSRSQAPVKIVWPTRPGKAE